MLTDSITEEIRSIRRTLATQFNNDLSRIAADIREHEHSDGRIYVRLERRPVCTVMTELNEVAKRAKEGV